ncbi:MAG: nucleotide sugar dehydrogenase [Microvirga sp.]
MSEASSGGASRESRPLRDTDHAAVLKTAIESRTASIAIVGMGYVGLPLAKAALDAGLSVIGIDIDPERVRKLNEGQSHVRHVSSGLIAEAVAARRFYATTDFVAIAEADAVVICVPTPLTRNREPDLTFIVRTAKEILPHLRRGHLVVLESTTYPGTTSDVLKPILEAGGLLSGTDFFLAFSPEREDPGNTEFGTARIPKVVGGLDPVALAMADTLYGALVDKTVKVSSAATAEAVKLTENIFRAVNIALVNELKVVFSSMGIDVWEVIEAAKTKPFGFMPFYPGPGLGGHCIPIDPFYLTWKAREYDVSTRFIELAGEINVRMPYWVLDRLVEALDRQAGRGLSGARILIVGLAYKKNVDDMRESPSLKLIELIEERGARVDYYDPFIPVIPVTREHAALAGRRSESLDPEVIARYNAVLIATDHDYVDYKSIAQNGKLVIDTRNVCERAGARGPHIVKA